MKEAAILLYEVMKKKSEDFRALPGNRYTRTEEIAEEAVEMTAFEDFVVERVQEGASIIGLYPATKEENQEAFVKWREKNGR